MVKIWEIDYTSLSGTTAVAFDNIGSQNLTSVTGVVVISGALPGFSFRPGVFLQKDSATPRYYSLQSGTVSNAYFRSTYTTRSYVMWLYTVNINPANSTDWDATLGGEGYLWVSNNASDSTIDAGFKVANTSPYDFRFTTPVTDLTRPTPVTPSTAWHMLAATIDKTNNLVKFYIDGVFCATASGATNIPASGAAGVDQIIGRRNTTREGTYYLGYTATYDHILSSGEVSTIYSTFLVDSVAGDDPYQTFSGTVYGTDGNPASGVNVLLLHDTTRQVEAYQTTNVSGYYSIVVPYAGNYTVVACNTPSGTRAFPMIAASGALYFT